MGMQEARPPLTVGILAETKNRWERRAPLTPPDVKWLVQRQIPVEVVSSPLRVFTDDEYVRAGACVTDRIEEADLLIGIKEPPADHLLPEKTYMVFSHTAKGQKMMLSI